MHHKLVVCHTQNEQQNEPPYYISFEKNTEDAVVQISTKENDVKLFKWRKDNGLTIKEERRDFLEIATLFAGNLPFVEVFYILIQEMEKPYHLETRNCQHLVNAIISKLSPRRESIKKFQTYYSQQSDKNKEELDKDLSNIKSFNTASKEIVNDVFDFLSKELNADEKLLEAIESLWSVEEIKEKLRDRNPNAKFEGRSIFMVAVMISDLFENPTELFEVLQGKTIDLNVTDAKGNTIIHLAVKKRPEILKYLIGLVGRKSDLISKVNYEGNTPLHIAVKHHNEEAILILIEDGCDQDKKKTSYIKLQPN